MNLTKYIRKFLLSFFCGFILLIIIGAIFVPYDMGIVRGFFVSFSVALGTSIGEYMMDKKISKK